jgi:hypothetical protein
VAFGTIGSALIIRAEPRLAFLWALIVVSAICAPFIPAICQERKTVIADGFLTATTMTGPRTIDLGKLRSARRIVLRGRSGAVFDFVLVSDANGVRIGLRHRDSLRAISAVPIPRLTPAAECRIHLRRRRAEWVWQLAGAAGAVTLMGCALAVAAVVCGAVIDG